MKELKAKRVPPGDRWALTSTEDDKIYSFDRSIKLYGDFRSVLFRRTEGRSSC